MAKSKGRTVAQSGKATAKKSTRIVPLSEYPFTFDETVDSFRQLATHGLNDDVPVMADLAISFSDIAPPNYRFYRELDAHSLGDSVPERPEELLREAKEKIGQDLENISIEMYEYMPQLRDRAISRMRTYLGSIGDKKKVIEGEYKDARSSLLGALQQKAAKDAATEAAVEQEAKNMEDALFENPSLSPSIKKRALSAAAMLDKMPKSATITQSMLNDVWRFVTGTTPKRKR